MHRDHAGLEPASAAPPAAQRSLLITRALYIARFTFHLLRLRSWSCAAWVMDYDGYKWH